VGDNGLANCKLVRVIGSFIERVEQELGLTCTGDGGSCGKTIEWIIIKFDAHRRANIEEARALELYLIEEFVKMLNANQEIRPFLIEYPISHKYITISLTFRGPLGPYADGVEYISNASEDLFYDAFDPFEFSSPDFYKEKYEEAVELAKASNLVPPFTHESTEREAALDASLIPFVNKMRMEQKFECWGIGCHDTQINQIKAKFVAIRRVTHEDARILALYVADNLLDHLNRNNKLKPFLAEAPFPTHRLKFRIDFVKRNYCPFTDGSIESVVVENNELSYFYIVKEPEEGVDEEYWMPRTTFLAKETYDEAKHLSAVKFPSLLTRLVEKAKSLFSR
ncbi:MAG: hypothetical protein LLG04_09490, partial [Parachlamydia sp.]|nr:hypothetical protein [Parachlamydia sp.]